MRTRHLLPPLALVAGSLTLAACGDGGSDGPETIVITSDDGKLTIEIPPEALDDEDVVMSITAVPLEELPEELQAASCRCRQMGLSRQIRSVTRACSLPARSCHAASYVDKAMVN